MQPISSSTFPLMSLDFYPSQKEMETFRKTISETFKDNLDKIDFSSFSPLHIAATLGDLKKCQDILLSNPDLLSHKIEDLNPFFLATIFGHEDIARFLFPLAKTKDFYLVQLLIINYELTKELLKECSAETKNAFFAILPAIPPSENSLTIFREASAAEQEIALKAAISVNSSLFLTFWDEKKPFSESSTNKLLIEALQVACLYDDLFFFKKVFEISSFTVKGNLFIGKYSWLQFAMIKKSTRIIAYLNQDSSHRFFSKHMDHCHLFSLRFSIAANDLDGTHQSLTSHLINSLIESLIPHKFPSLTPAEKSEMLESLYRSDLKEPLILQENSKRLITIATGWKGHAVSAIFSQNIVALIDTGEAICPGIQFYKINKLDYIPKAIENLIKMKDLSEEKGKAFFQRQLPKKLDLEVFGYIRLGQTAGTCAWTSLKASVLGLFVLNQLRKQQETIGMSSNELNNLLATTHKTPYNEWYDWSFEDKLSFFFSGLLTFSLYRNLFNLPLIYHDLLLKLALEKEFIFFKTLLKDHPFLKDWIDISSQKSLIRHIFSQGKEHFTTVLKLISLDFDPLKKDVDGLSLADDILSDGVSVKRKEKRKQQIQKLIDENYFTNAQTEIVRQIFSLN